MASGETKAQKNLSELYEGLYLSSYLLMQYNFIEFFSEHLVDVCRVFDADLQSVVVLALVGQSELSARIRSNFHTQGAMPAEAVVGRPPGVNASSIAEISGIPRETVRRKLEGLAKRGWIERDSRGLWRIAQQEGEAVAARRQLVDLELRSMKRISRFLGAMHALAVEKGARSDAKSIASAESLSATDAET